MAENINVLPQFARDVPRNYKDRLRDSYSVYYSCYQCGNKLYCQLVAALKVNVILLTLSHHQRLFFVTNQGGAEDRHLSLFML